MSREHTDGADDLSGRVKTSLQMSNNVRKGPRRTVWGPACDVWLGSTPSDRCPWRLTRVRYETDTTGTDQAPATLGRWSAPTM